MARLLVTGGAGFIGANFVHHWLAQHPGDRVVVLDALTYAGKRSNLAAVEGRSEYRFVHGDICDTPLVGRLLREERIDTIVHLAAESHVDRSIEGPDAFIQTNVIGTHSMLTAARRVWLEERTVPQHRFLHMSTDEVYGSLAAGDPPFTESSPYGPSSPYSASKAAADHLVHAYHRTYGLQTTITNCSNGYGPYQFPEKLIPLMISRLVGGNELPVYGDGRYIRNWQHVADHCRGIEAALVRGRPGELYNIGGSTECENIELVRRLCALVDERIAGSEELRHRYPNSRAARRQGSEDLISFVQDRPGHDRRYASNCSKIERHCGFRPQNALAEGLRLTVDWYLERPESLQSGWQRTAV